MNFKAIKAILKKDILDGMKNYHVILMVLTPIVLSLLFSKVILKNKSGDTLPELGFIASSNQPLIESLVQKGMKNKISFYQDRNSLDEALLEGKVKFGLIMPTTISEKMMSKKEISVTLIYPPSVPDFAAETIKYSFENLIREQLNIKAPPLPFTLNVEAVGSKSGKNSSADNILPMLMLMGIGVIGFLALPMAIVEEREKGTLNAIFLTPITPAEFILGKSIFSFGLIMFTMILMLTLNSKWNENWGYLLLIAALGALICIFIGLIIATFAKNQASVNALGTLLFLVFQMVPTLQHTDALKSIAPLVPSTYIFDGIKKALFMDLSKFGINNELIVATSVMLVTYLLAYFAYKLKGADK